ncbi:FAD-binding oxidoreductase [Microbacterium sp. SORGH_AS_0888]|uniref:FAD-binding oxidoreductase n=1 Tax=Microbacterium sp. SORGH_AS_0888 TaxID=3041791 RepID=UPI00278A9F7F|nr:FAD-binding oxidoreductase [Microbacterium sp. SORGH_AS_0888]MDQ1130113.1 ferredoxin-NADP reductase [Microbacterium sp. SORGH_AS_0888]
MTGTPWLPAHVVDVRDLTPRSRSIVLEVPGWPGSLPGQHLDVRLTAEDGYRAERSYSIAGFGPGERVELAVDEVVDGEVSPYLVRDIRPGDFLEVKGPLGMYFVWRDADPSPVQLIAGGSGVVPLLSIARARAVAGTDQPFRLLCSVRSPEDAMYRDEIEGLEAAGVEVEWIYTRRAPARSARGAGRVRPGELATLTWPPERHPLVFVCGPTSFVEYVADVLVDAGHPALRIRTERFG